MASLGWLRRSDEGTVQVLEEAVRKTTVRSLLQRQMRRAFTALPDESPAYDGNRLYNPLQSLTPQVTHKVFPLQPWRLGR